MGKYPALEKLYETFHDQGLEVIGIGCNQFKSPKKIEKVRKDLKERYGVQFPLYDKIDVLIDGNGVPVRRYRPGVGPEEITADIETLLKTGKVPPARKKSLNEY